MENKRSKHPSWQRRHEGVLLYLLQNPSATLHQCASATGYSAWHLSRIINSPIFKQRFNTAIDEVIFRQATQLITPKLGV